ncbi:hypothetical protein F4861DRAFT_520634 [Xylaria intraflava]|nr:hypothetical protein F4861DRAFT_520634 [Xylaria intraflava]
MIQGLHSVPTPFIVHCSLSLFIVGCSLDTPSRERTSRRKRQGGLHDELSPGLRRYAYEFIQELSFSAGSWQSIVRWDVCDDPCHCSRNGADSEGPGMMSSRAEGV